ISRGRHRALTGFGTIGERPVLLVKPLTYMNLSGQAVAPLARAYGITPERILVVSDDLDLDVGKLRFKMKGSAGGHNGHKSLIAALGTQEYPRIKIGIGHVSKMETLDHVLTRFEPDEKEFIEAAISVAVAACEQVAAGQTNDVNNEVAEHNRSLAS